MEPCGILDYCYGNNALNFGVDFAQNGQWADILVFCYVIVHIYHMQFFKVPSSMC